jgi:hypothetical protein
MKLDASASTHLSLSLSLFCQGSRGYLAATPSRQAPLCGGVGRVCREWSSPVVERRVASASVFSAEWSRCGVEWSGTDGCHRLHIPGVVASWGVSLCVDPAHGASDVQCSEVRCDGVPNPRSHRRLTHAVPERCRGASPNRVLRRPLPVVPVFPVVGGGARGSYVQRRGPDGCLSGSRRFFVARERGWFVKGRAVVSYEWCLAGFGMEVERASGNCLSGSGSRPLRERRGER